METLMILCSDESGQGLIEYSLILALATIVVIGTFILFGESVYNLYEMIKEGVINVL